MLVCSWPEYLLHPIHSFNQCIHDLTNNKILSLFHTHMRFLFLIRRNYFTRIICKGFMLVCSSHILFAASIGTAIVVLLWFCSVFLCTLWTRVQSEIRCCVPESFSRDACVRTFSFLLYQFTLFSISVFHLHSFALSLSLFRKQKLIALELCAHTFKVEENVNKIYSNCCCLPLLRLMTLVVAIIASCIHFFATFIFLFLLSLTLLSPILYRFLHSGRSLVKCNARFRCWFLSFTQDSNV